MSERQMQLSVSRTARRQAGFTMPDVLVGTLIALATLAIVATFNRVQLFALRNQIAQVDVQTVGRNLTDLFTREVRRAGTNPTCSPFEAIVEARADRIRFRHDTNGDGVIDPAVGEEIAYRLDLPGQIVTREASGVSEAILTGVTLAGSRLRYFNGAGGEIIPAGNPPELTAAQRGSVRRVRLELDLAVPGRDPRNPAPHTARFSSDVNLRNRFFLESVSCG